jgi:hypothetical protein
MENSRELVVGTDESPGFLQQCLLSKVASATDEFVQSTCNNYSRLLGLLDAIWSTVRGISGGLLPTNEQKMNKFNKFGGLADKSDETIEKGHQTLKLLRDRFRGTERKLHPTGASSWKVSGNPEAYSQLSDHDQAINY